MKKILNVGYSIYVPKVGRKAKIPILRLPSGSAEKDRIKNVFHDAKDSVFFIVYDDDDFQVVPLSKRINELFSRSTYDRIAIYVWDGDVSETEGRLVPFYKIVQEG